MQQKPSWAALGGLIGVFTLAGGGFYVSGQQANAVEEHERRLEQHDESLEALTTIQTGQAVAIGMIQAQNTHVLDALDRIDRKLEQLGPRGRDKGWEERQPYGRWPLEQQ